MSKDDTIYRTSRLATHYDDYLDARNAEVSIGGYAYDYSYLMVRLQGSAYALGFCEWLSDWQESRGVDDDQIYWEAGPWHP